MKIIPPFQVLLLGFVSWVFHDNSRFLHIHFGFEYLVSRVLLVLALVLVVIAIIEFSKHRTTVSPVKISETKALITTGIYSLSRNPIYLADAIILVAWAVWIGYWLGLLTVPIFLFTITKFQVHPEESMLEEKFGEKYRNYCTNTRRWL